MKRLCVFCGSQVGSVARYRASARLLGERLVERKIGLVFGGGHIGLMGVLADTVLENGGDIIGVIPQALVDRELAHKDVKDMRIVTGMHERKAVMAELSDAFAALPGGFGTADEMFEILTWAQLKLHHKPVGVLNEAGFFDPLLAWLDRAVTDGFLKAKHRALLVTANDPDELLERLGLDAPDGMSGGHHE